MTTDAQKVPMAALDALLEAERLVLLEGRLGDLEPLLPTKEMEMLKQINTSIETYDQSGQKMSIGVPVAPTVEKRA